MLFILFGTAAAATVLAASALSNYAKTLSQTTSLAGMVLLASATTLPELTTSISAVSLGNPDIAIGNMLGSNMFNFFIIASADIWYRKIRLYQSATHNHIYTAILGLVLSFTAFLALIRHSNHVIFRFGIDALFIALIYGLGMYIISKIVRSSGSAQNETANNRTTLSDKTSSSVPKTTAGFFIMAFLITTMGSVLSLTGNEIVKVTGIESSFVGSFFLAVTTSMPEAIAVVVALRLKNIDLALGSLLSSNILNILILIGLDAFYLDGPILSHVSSIHQMTALSISILCFVLIFALRRKKK